MEFQGVEIKPCPICGDTEGARKEGNKLVGIYFGYASFMSYCVRCYRCNICVEHEVTHKFIPKRCVEAEKKTGRCRLSFLGDEYILKAIKQWNRIKR